MTNRYRVSAIRDFNRTYTRIIGLLDDGMMQSAFSLVEARLIHEIGKREGATASTLAADLNMDRGQLSRLVRRLGDAGLIIATKDETDGRASHLSLTTEGQQACQELNTMSDAATAKLISPLGEVLQRQLVQSMQTIQEILIDEVKSSSLTIRPHRVGEIGWLIHRQAVLYNLEYGWNSDFEALITKIYAEFDSIGEGRPKSLWIAECNGEIVGSVFVIPSEEQKNVAQLRMLYVEPSARGQGIGRRLVAEALIFSRASNYERITLWTQDCLTSARKIYQAAEFKLVSKGKHHSFGQDLNGQYWERTLTD